MFYIYIIYSFSSDLFYLGYSRDAIKRFKEHNSSPFDSFTARHRPWVLKAVFAVGDNESGAVKLERFLKKQKSRKLIEALSNPENIPSGKLAQLVRVPHLRD
jgi:putative endonuclease